MHPRPALPHLGILNIDAEVTDGPRNDRTGRSIFPAYSEAVNLLVTRKQRGDSDSEKASCLSPSEHGIRTKVGYARICDRGLHAIMRARR